MSDAHPILTRRLQAYFGAHGLTPQLRASRSDRWASATFSGARHHFDYAIEEAKAVRERLSQAGGSIGEAEFRLPGHIVADIDMVTSAGEPARFAIEVLTVEAG